MGEEDDWKRRTEEKGWKVEQMIGRGKRRIEMNEDCKGTREEQKRGEEKKGKEEKIEEYSIR